MMPYSITGKRLDLDRQTSGDFTRRTQKEARTRALERAEAVSVPIIYLSSGVAQTDT